MSLYDWIGIKDRPPRSRLTWNQNHPFRTGLRFAALGLGGCVYSKKYTDSSLFGNSGTLTGMDPATDWLWSSELGRWCVDFDGSDDYVLLSAGAPAQWPAAPPFWISMWIKAVNWQGSEVMLSVDSTYVIATNAAGPNISGRWAGTSATAGVDTTSVVDGSWHHFGVQFASTTVLRSYWDGSPLNNSSTYSVTPFDGTTIACRMATSPRTFFAGQIADVIVASGLYESNAQQLADRSNVMLSGLILPPTRRFWPVATAGEETPDLLLPHHGMMAI